VSFPRLSLLALKWIEQRENHMGTKKKDTPVKPGSALSKERLNELVEEAVVDAHDESEQASGFYTMLENDLQLPFETQILGVTVSVESIDITEDDQLVAVCHKGKTKQRISLSELPLPSPAPEGSEWIVAYRYWQTGEM
jgi:Calcium binding